MRQVLLLGMTILFSCMGGERFQLDPAFKLQGHRGGSLDRSHFDANKTLVVYVNSESLTKAETAWYLADCQTKGFSIVYLVDPSVDLKKLDAENSLRNEYFQGPSSLYAGIPVYPAYRLFEKGLLGASGKGLPNDSLLIEWVEPLIPREEVTLLLGTDGFFRQKHTNDCAAASVTMFLERLGSPLLPEEVYRELDRGPEGALVSLKEVKLFLDQVDIQADGWKGSLSDLANLDKPAILQVNPEHFVVMTAASELGVVVLDPKLGRRYLPADLLAKEWKGVYFYADKTI